ncbi:MAG: hypothetical protein FJ264_13575 [Planctomycetes bacterium]|nr:hypothetical protein [Planctomycetota bacterium]
MVLFEENQKYPWYQIIKGGDEITQGDIIKNCYIPIPGESFYEAILAESSEPSGSVDINSGDFIILTQACDIINDKIDSIVMCPVWALSFLMKKDSYYNSKNGRESIRQGKEPAYHLLNSYRSNDTGIDLPYSIVDFHRIYSLPKQYLKSIAEKNSPRIRLLPPYREHLSQAFARYFMRVGLPIDIPKDEIRNVTVG